VGKPRLHFINEFITRAAIRTLKQRLTQSAVNSAYFSVFSIAIMSNSSIKHNGVVEDGTFDIGISSTRQIGITKVSSLQNSRFQLGIGKISTNLTQHSPNRRYIDQPY
jgi:hypothetical protein